MRPHCTSTQAALLRAVTAMLAEAGEAAPVVTLLTATDWASVTFDGRRETMALAVPPGVARRLVAELPDREIPIPGWIIADLAVAARPGGVSLEMLVVRD